MSVSCIKEKCFSLTDFYKSKLFLSNGHKVISRRYQEDICV